MEHPFKMCLSTAQSPFEIVAAGEPVRSPGPGEVTVRVEASCLNYHDVAVASGRKRIDDGLVPLTDGAGTVEAVGPGVREFQPGDRVISLFLPNWVGGRPTVAALNGVPGDQVDGFAATHVTRGAKAFTKAPAGLTAVEAATLPCAALTAWRALFVENSIKPGDWVVTQGTGGVSIFALQLAKAAGARVICTTSSAEKAERLRELGADEIINYREVPRWSKRVTEATCGVGADLIVEVGGADTLAQSVYAARVGGRIAVIGILSGTEGMLPVQIMVAKNVALTGLSVGSRADQENMVSAFEANGIKPVVDRVFALRDLSEAFDYHREGRHFGKVCLEH